LTTREHCLEYAENPQSGRLPITKGQYTRGPEGHGLWKHSQQKVEERWLEIHEIRLVSDLRIMHAKVAELHQLAQALKRHHDEAAVVKYADQPVLTEYIQHVDEIYLWFVKLKEESIAQRSRP